MTKYTGWASTLNSPRLDEMCHCFHDAVANCRDLDYFDKLRNQCRTNLTDLEARIEQLENTLANPFEDA